MKNLAEKYLLVFQPLIFYTETCFLTLFTVRYRSQKLNSNFPLVTFKVFPSNFRIQCDY